MLKNLIQKNAYYDSATLMLLSSKIAPELGGSSNCAVMMGSDMNKNLMRQSGLLNADGEAASPNDLIFAARHEDEKVVDEAIAHAQELLAAKNSAKAKQNAGKKHYTSTRAALEDHPDAELAVVSLPGSLAHVEVKRLLKAGVNVLLFSDNVTLENEIALKKLAVEKGLLMMGPDCGTAVINGIGLGFANKLNRGPVGIVAASGTGLQEVMTLVSNAGVGISQAIGTGGRDLKAEVGGLMCFQALDFLEEDPDTELICVISKPPAAEVVRKLSDKIRSMKKPVIACLLGADPALLADCNATFAPTLTKAAECILEAMGQKGAKIPTRAGTEEKLKAAHAARKSEQKYIRGLYCGGTLAYETQIVLAESGEPIYSNAPLNHDYELTDLAHSKGHCILDLGDDAFTVGKPHPMIEPSLRGERLLQEALDPETAVILLDIETGYGSHESAGEILAEEVREAQAALAKQGRTLPFFATVCGAKGDSQGYEKQMAILEAAGLIVFESNEQMARAALALLR